MICLIYQNKNIKIANEMFISYKGEQHGNMDKKSIR